MASLLNQPIDTTYQGLIKTSDNGAINATPKSLEDGTGTTLPVQVGTGGMVYSGTQDFTGATVLGVAAEAGLVSGTAVNSMKSADTLTDLPNVATGQSSVAIGRNVDTTQVSAVGIGNFVNVVGCGPRSIAIGQEVEAQKTDSIALGAFANSTEARGIAIGVGSKARAEDAINIGSLSVVDDAVRVESVTIGSHISANTKSAQYAVSVGSRAFAIGDYAVALGHTAVAAGSRAIAIGYNTQSNLNDGVALGANVTSVWAGGVTMNQLALVNYATLDYADDTAAAAGGVPLGGIYHTSGALKIRIA